MKDEKNNIKKINVLWQKIKDINFKKFARAFAIVWMIIFIIVMTITNVGIDKNFNWLKWLGSAMILFGIAVFGIFIGESMGTDFFKEKKDGLYQINLGEYNMFRRAIDDIIIHFSLFYDWLIPQRLEDKQINFLIMNDVNPTKAKRIVKYCDANDLWNLKKEAIKIVDEKTGEEIYIKKLNQHEIEPVEEVLKGRVKLELSGSSYYLQAFAESNQRDVIEQGEGFKKARKENKKTNRAIRLVSGVVISLGLGILTVNDFMRAGDGQAWMNLVTRIANLFTALFSGWLSGAGDVKLEASAIENKTDVLKMFKSAYDKKLFVVYDEDEDAKRIYEQQEAQKKKDIEEANKNVVEPEVVIQLEQEEPTQIEMKPQGK